MGLTLRLAPYKAPCRGLGIQRATHKGCSSVLRSTAEAVTGTSERRTFSSAKEAKHSLNAIKY